MQVRLLRWLSCRLARIEALQAVIHGTEAAGPAGVAGPACLIDVLPENVVFLALSTLGVGLSIQVVG